MQILRRDRHRLRKASKTDPSVAASAALYEQRSNALQRLNLKLNPELPVADQATQITALLREHPVVVVAGETGSGKTTQLPKLCMQLGLGAGAMIGHTQPRRLAARTVAKRIAAETNCQLGEEVGFAVRFSDRSSDQTLLKVMTDGLLLTEIRRDRFLDNYDAIIIDEAHERSLNIDFLLGYLKRLLNRRKDLKVIITSATIDLQRFSNFFGGAPIVEVGGRTYPVEVKYRDAPEQDTLDGVVEALQEIEARPMGPARDVLVFFSGEREIFEAARVLRKTFEHRFEVLPLYARLSFAEQRRIFEPTSALRRIVLATNVAETSLTVPNIGYVIDPGFARINRYSYRSKLQRLPVEPISQASADQRKGRCGRVAPGVCYRLYGEQDFLSRPEFTDAEIHRVNLASVVLQMQAFRLGDISRFGFIDPPDPRAVRDAVRLLEELQAIDNGKLTDAGRAMARMPVDPRLARMLVEAQAQGALEEALIIVSGLAVQDPRERPLQKAQAADESHARFADEKSDFMTLLKLWRWVEEQRQELTRNRFRTLLGKRFISEPRVREWREIHRQLLLVCRELKFAVHNAPAGYRAIHEAVLSGSLSLIAQHDERGRYIGARNLKMRIFPGSGLAGRTPKWIVAGEIAETTRVYARMVAAVEPGWIERQAEHMVKRNYSAPFWSLKRGEAMAHMNLSLYGLRLAEQRQVSYSRIDPGASRDLFLREGLVAGRLTKPPDFLRHNLEQIAAVEELEAKGRRRDLLLNEDDIYAFYAQKIPERLVRLSDLTHWLRRAPREVLDGLYLDSAMLMKRSDVAVAEADFPGELVLGDMELSLRYRFAPGEKDDGVSVPIPVGVLPGISPEALEWLVPGLLPNLIEQWLRTLPKQKRRTLVPLPEKVEELCATLLKPDQYRQGRLLSALGSLLNDRYRLTVSETDWDRERIDEHLLMHIEIVDDNGKVLGAGRDVRELKKRLAGGSEAQNDKTDVSRLERAGLGELGDIQLDDQVIVGSGRARSIRFPGLVDGGDHVDLQMFADKHERERAHRRGLCRLALLHLGKAGGYFRKELDKHPHLGLRFASLGNAAQLKDELLRNVVWYCFFEGAELPGTQQQIDDLLSENRPALAGIFSSTVALLDEILALRFECVRALDTLTSAAYTQAVADAREQLERLVPLTVLEITPYRYLPLVQRDLQGLLRRLQNLPGHVPQDLNKIRELTPFYERLDRIRAAELAQSDRVCDLCFLLEELRLKLFAEPVSRAKLAPHPLDSAYFGPGWKASAKRVSVELLAEEQRLGLA